MRRGSGRRSTCTRCAIVLQRTSMIAVSTSERSRRCSDIRSWKRRRATLACPRACSPPSRARSTSSATTRERRSETRTRRRRSSAGLVFRPALEVADIFHDHGPAWRLANAGHVSLDQLKVMSAIERCRTAALGGHVAQCENHECRNTVIGYNSCRNRHCPKCQGAAAREWLAEREGELLPVPCFHVVYTLPGTISD